MLWGNWSEHLGSWLITIRWEINSIGMFAMRDILNSISGNMFPVRYGNGPMVIVFLDIWILKIKFLRLTISAFLQSTRKFYPSLVERDFHTLLNCLENKGHKFIADTAIRRYLTTLCCLSTWLTEMVVPGPREISIVIEVVEVGKIWEWLDQVWHPLSRLRGF